MRNVLEDSGHDAFYTLGPPDETPSNGVFMLARPKRGMPIALARTVSLPDTMYEAWILTRAVLPRLKGGRAVMLLEADDRWVGEIAAETAGPRPFWDDRPRWEWLYAGRIVGQATREIRLTFQRAKSAFDSLGEVDALAF